MSAGNGCLSSYRRQMVGEQGYRRLAAVATGKLSTAFRLIAQCKRWLILWKRHYSHCEHLIRIRCQGRIKATHLKAKSMQRQCIAQLKVRENVDEIFRVADKQIRANRQGSDYLLLQLTDRTGQITGLRWNASQSLYETFQKGDFLRIMGTSQLHNGLLQIIVQDFEPVPAEKVDLTDFEKNNSVEIDDLIAELKTWLSQLSNPHLRHLADNYLNDQSLMAGLRRAPAGVKTHHAYEGGLLQHLVSLMKAASAIAGLYTQIDRDLLLMGVFLHDLGKIEELCFDGEMTYTDAGQMLGHLVQGAIELDRRIASIERQTTSKFPESLRLRLLHLVVSHHGQLEHGSPKIPMTIEAIVLAYLDDLDAKINQATELIAADRNTDSAWTTFHPSLNRKLYKPSLRS